VHQDLSFWGTYILEHFLLGLNQEYSQGVADE
jgi:hypothetical protein